MKLVPQTSPYIRKNVSVARMMGDVIVALIPITLFAMIYNGWGGIYVILLSLATMLCGELLCTLFIKWPKDMKFKELFTKEGFSKVKQIYTINNFLAPIISALIFALIMPANCSPYVVILGALFGIVVGKMLFGGLGQNIFNPAAAGRIFATICFGAKINAANVSTIVADATPLASVKGNLNAMVFDLGDLFLGSNIGGTLGEGCKLLILVGGLYLFVRRSADLRSALSYFLSFALVMFVAVASYSGKYEGNVAKMWAYQLLSGGVIFAAVFMITDPVTSPTTKFGRVAFGAIAGSITALIRVVGAYPEGAAFSILIANTIAPALDYFMRGKPNTYTWKQCLVLGIGMVIVCCIASASVMGGWF